METTRVNETVANAPISGYQPAPSSPHGRDWEAAPKPEHAEGRVARAIEQQTAQLPSDLFLWAALGSMAVSLWLQLADKREESLFIGQWAPSFLLLGLYNKLVKVAGSH